MSKLSDKLNKLTVTISRFMLIVIKVLRWLVIIVATGFTSFDLFIATSNHISWFNHGVTTPILGIWLRVLVLLLLFYVMQWCYQKAIDIITTNFH